MRYSTELSFLFSRYTRLLIRRGCAIALLAATLQSCQEASSNAAGTSTSTAAIDRVPAELTIVSPLANQPDGSAFIQTAENNLEVTQMAAKDGLGSTFSYRLQDGEDIDKFTIDEETGVLKFKDLPDWEQPMDSDSNNNYMVLWQALSSSGEARSQFVIVQVTDLPDE